MNIILGNYTVPERGHVDVKVNVSFEIKVTAEEARKKVARWLDEQISMLLGADAPTLAVGKQTVWRVPVWIGFPSTGKIPGVGTVLVDVKTGEILSQERSKADILKYLGKEVKPRLPAESSPIRELPVEYLANLNPPPEFMPR